MPELKTIEIAFTVTGMAPSQADLDVIVEKIKPIAEKKCRENGKALDQISQTGEIVEGVYHGTFKATTKDPISL